MPLKRGRSRKVISEYIRELMHTYHREGRIGRSRPADARKAVKQAAAIAYALARRGRNGEGEGRGGGSRDGGRGRTGGGR
jgi:hypothetical protein